MLSLLKIHFQTVAYYGKCPKQRGERQQFKRAKVQKNLQRMAAVSEKDDPRLVKCQQFEQYYDHTGANECRLDWHLEICLQHDDREYAHSLHGYQEEQRLHP